MNNMAFENDMTILLNKIERHLGTRPLNLPDFLKKDNWVKVIEEETLTTFSRYIPHKFPIVLTQENRKGDYFIIDENVIGGNAKILGVRDIRWEKFGPNAISNTQSFGVFDFFSGAYGLDDMAMVQMRADQVSLFNNGIFLEFEAPNKIKLKSCTGADVTRSIPSFEIDVFLRHPNNLMTIAPTKMETFEALAQADIARFLYEELKYYDGLDTVFANIDLKLDDIKTESDKRDEIIQGLKESYVSAGNEGQPIMYTI
jgi:hypothetical protein